MNKQRQLQQAIQPTVLNHAPLLHKLLCRAAIATPKADDYEIAELLAHEAWVNEELRKEAQAGVLHDAHVQAYQYDLWVREPIWLAL